MKKVEGKKKIKTFVCPTCKERLPVKVKTSNGECRSCCAINHACNAITMGVF
jgi:hypothetical protein